MTPDVQLAVNPDGVVTPVTFKLAVPEFVMVKFNDAVKPATTTPNARLPCRVTILVGAAGELPQDESADATQNASAALLRALKQFMEAGSILPGLLPVKRCAFTATAVK